MERNLTKKIPTLSKILPTWKWESTTKFQHTLLSWKYHASQNKKYVYTFPFSIFFWGDFLGFKSIKYGGCCGWAGCWLGKPNGPRRLRGESFLPNPLEQRDADHARYPGLLSNSFSKMGIVNCDSPFFIFF